MKNIFDILPIEISKLLCKELVVELSNASWNIPMTRTIADLSTAIGSHPGTKRPRNEDRSCLMQITSISGELFTIAIVCDGVGSSEMGDTAATLCVATIASYFVKASKNQPLTKLIADSVRNADEIVRTCLSGKGTTTLSMFVLSNSGQYAAVNIGDSRIFGWSPSVSLHQISVDDTLENELKDLKIKNDNFLDYRGLRGSLSQAIGEGSRTQSELRVNIISQENINKDSGLVLATDGAWKASGSTFELMVANATNASETVRRTLALATWVGGVDNISVIAIENINLLLAESIDTYSSIQGSSRIVAWFGDTKCSICMQPFVTKAAQDPRKEKQPEETSPPKKAIRRSSKKTKSASDKPKDLIDVIASEEQKHRNSEKSIIEVSTKEKLSK